MSVNKIINISKYATFFHDGDVNKIVHSNHKIELWMESAEIDPEWNEDNVILSTRRTLTGKLHVDGVKDILENDDHYLGPFKMKDMSEKAMIYDFEIHSLQITLNISWITYPYHESDVFFYEIKAEKIYWENIPTLFDAYWDSI